jgi:type IV secretory pathway TraG/TraD family ATPase VirD4
VIVATQELADLDRAARGLREQVLGNTAFKLVLRQDVPRSAETVAELVGTRWVWERTYRTHRTVFGDGSRRGDGTKKQVEEYLVHPNEIKRLRTGEAIVITKTPVAQARRVRVSPARSRDGVER